MAQILTKVGCVFPRIQGILNKSHTNSAVEDYFAETDAFVWNCIDEVFNDFHYPDLTPDLLYIVKSKANFERAAFIRLILEGKNCNWKRHGRLLVAEELMYFFQMVLDDIMDESPMRKGNPTAHIKFGTGKALSYAEILHTFSHELIAREARSIHLEADDILEAWSGFAHMISNICFAQCLDLDFETMSLDDVDEEMYFTFLKNTTPTDIANCLKAGAIFSRNTTPEEVELLERIGLRLGMIMQIRDDLIDFINDKEVIGKTPLLDVKQNKKRIPIIVMYNFATPENKKRIKSILGKDDLSDDDISFLNDQLCSDLVSSYVVAIGEQMKSTALGDIDKVNLADRQKTMLKEIIEGVANFG